VKDLEKGSMDTPIKEKETPYRAANDPVTVSSASAAGNSMGIGRRRRLAVGLIVILALGLGVYFLAINPRLQNSRELAALAITAGQKTVTVVKPTQSDATAPLILPGNIEANRSASIYARVDGYLKKWYVDIGDHVKEGQVLADIEAPQIDANLREAQAQLELAQANLKLAQTNSTRSQQLFANKVNSQQELDTVVATEQVQQATQDTATASLENAKQMKAYEQVRAPFDGVITARYVDVGSLVTSGSVKTVQKLFDLAQSDPVRVFVNVPQSDVERVQPGSSATVKVDEYPNETFTGKVARDAGAFDQASRTILLEVDVPNPNGRLYAGMYAHVTLSTPDPHPLLYVPDNTILIDSKGTRVATVDPDHKIHFKLVTLGRDFGTKSEIVSGLSPNDLIIQNPTDDLQEGMVVSVQG
jgi:membrane fusion protein, multidrug efflux system